VAVAIVACQAKPDPPAVQTEPHVAAVADEGRIGAAAAPLPPGCELWAVGASGKKWKVSAVRIELRTPDGPTEVGFMEDGAVEVRCFGMQQLRFGAAAGVDDVIRLELAK
jgi:hypothetical protein